MQFFKSLKETLLEISFPIVSRVPLAAHKIVQRAETVFVSTAKLQWLQSIVDQNPDIVPRFHDMTAAPSGRTR